MKIFLSGLTVAIISLMYLSPISASYTSERDANNSPTVCSLENDSELNDLVHRGTDSDFQLTANSAVTITIPKGAIKEEQKAILIIYDLTRNKGAYKAEYVSGNSFNFKPLKTGKYSIKLFDESGNEIAVDILLHSSGETEYKKDNNEKDGLQNDVIQL